MSALTKPVPHRSDYLRALITALCAALLFFDLVPSVLEGNMSLGPGAWFAAYAAVLIWLGLSAWRRTVWGCVTQPGSDGQCAAHGSRCGDQRPAE